MPTGGVGGIWILRSLFVNRPKAGPALIVVAAVTAMLALPALALAHLERPSYWPDRFPALLDLHVPRLAVYLPR